jgi:hypothetical protein
VSDGPKGSLQERIAQLQAVAAAFAASRAGLRDLSTPGAQRASLRLVGVDGLDGKGEPLASGVVERATAAGLVSREEGILLPLAGASAASGLGARELALAMAAGTVDLAAEDMLLQDPVRAAAARERLAQWRAEAGERIDANRTARHELGDALGRPGIPWVGGRIRDHALDAATDEARAFADAGADVLLVRVPRGRELLAGLPESAEEPLPAEMDPPPAGSQRGLAGLRGALDEMAAERGHYLLLGTTTEPLGAPEQALVAAYEGIDLVFADPLEEVALGVAADRALADHAAAHAILQRSGVTLVLSAGRLMAGPELRRGEDVAAHTRVARTIAAQAASAAWAEASGLATEHILLQAPFELPTTRSQAALLVASILLRRRLFPDHAFVLSQPADAAGDAWRTDLPVCLLAAGETRLIVHGAPAADFALPVEATRAAAALAAVIPEVLAPGEGQGPRFAESVLAIAADLAAEALETFAIAEREGWEGLAGSDGVTGAAPVAAGAARMLNRERRAGA